VVDKTSIVKLRTLAEAANKSLVGLREISTTHSFVHDFIKYGLYKQYEQRINLYQLDKGLAIWAGFQKKLLQQHKIALGGLGKLLRELPEKMKQSPSQEIGSSVEKECKTLAENLKNNMKFNQVYDRSGQIASAYTFGKGSLWAPKGADAPPGFTLETYKGSGITKPLFSGGFSDKAIEGFLQNSFLGTRFRR
jgi:hypothetical protein